MLVPMKVGTFISLICSCISPWQHYLGHSVGIPSIMLKNKWIYSFRKYVNWETYLVDTNKYSLFNLPKRTEGFLGYTISSQQSRKIFTWKIWPFLLLFASSARFYASTIKALLLFHCLSSNTEVFGIKRLLGEILESGIIEELREGSFLE